MKWILGLMVFLSCWFLPLSSAHAALHGELSLLGSYSKTDYGDGTYSTSRTYTASLGMYVTSTTQIELSFSSTENFFNNDPTQTLLVKEENLGLSVVQSLVPPTWMLQPYVKVGGAQYNRRQSGTTSGIPDRVVETKSPSAVFGAGLRIYLIRNFSLKGEAVTYLPDMHISEAKNNLSMEIGVGWRF